MLENEPETLKEELHIKRDPNSKMLSSKPWIGNYKFYNFKFTGLYYNKAKIQTEFRAAGTNHFYTYSLQIIMTKCSEKLSSRGRQTIIDS